MASNSELEELKKLLDETPDLEADSDQSRFFKAVGAQPLATGKVGADVIYFKYLTWKQELGETDVVNWWNFFKKPQGFPSWIKKMVDTGRTVYRLDPKHFPASDYVSKEMRRLWRAEKKYRKKLAEAKQNTTDLKKNSSRK